MNKYIINILLLGMVFQSFAIDKLKLTDLTDKINKQEFKQMTSVLVSQNSKLVYEKYFNEGAVDFKNDMRSASKSITSLAIGMAIQQQLIKDINLPVYPYFDDKHLNENLDPRKTKITLQDLLTMSSVLECDDWNSASRGQEERMYIIEDWSKFILNLPVKGTPPWKKTAQDSKYGRAFSYCTGGVQVLADIVERVTKSKMSVYLQDKLFNPLGIDAPEFSYTPLGVTNGGGGMQMTSKDWIKIGQLFLDNGKHNGASLIEPNWIKESFKRRAVIDEDKNIEYGYLWWIFDFKIGEKLITAYAAAGNGGNYLFILPKLSATVVITSKAYNTNYMHQQSQKILTDFIIPALFESP